MSVEFIENQYQDQRLVVILWITELYSAHSKELVDRSVAQKQAYAHHFFFSAKLCTAEV